MAMALVVPMIAESYSTLVFFTFIFSPGAHFSFSQRREALHDQGEGWKDRDI